MSKVPYKPEGFHSVTPYLIVPGVDRLIEFLKQAFGGEPGICTRHPDGSIMHADIRIGDSMIEMGEASETWKARPGTLHLYVEDVDAIYQRALNAGATSLYEPDDKPYGSREAGVEDPSGNYWFLATHKENVSEEEFQRRMAAAGKS